MIQHLPSTKVAVGTVSAGVLSAYLAGIDWEALVVAVVTLVLSYVVPELNPPPSAAARLQAGKVPD